MPNEPITEKPWMRYREWRGLDADTKRVRRWIGNDLSPTLLCAQIMWLCDEIDTLRARHFPSPTASEGVEDGLATNLEAAIDFVRSLPIGSMGEARDGRGEAWPLRDELADSLCRIRAAILEAPAAKDAEIAELKRACSVAIERAEQRGDDLTAALARAEKAEGEVEHAWAIARGECTARLAAESKLQKAVEAERERCAKIADSWVKVYVTTLTHRGVAHAIRDAIRARANTPPFPGAVKVNPEVAGKMLDDLEKRIDANTPHLSPLEQARERVIEAAKAWHETETVDSENLALEELFSAIEAEKGTR